MADVVAEIVPKPDTELGFGVRQEHLTWQPPGGFSFGIALPADGKEFVPAPFKDGVIYKYYY
jgi:hypothetical protein